MLTPEQKNNFVDFWTPRGWTMQQAVSKLVLADSKFEDQVTDLYDTLRPTGELPVGTVNAVLETIEHGVLTNGIAGKWDWMGGENGYGYGIASVYTKDGVKTSIAATRLVYKLVTGIEVQPRKVEVLDHINHDPGVCTDRKLCVCIKSVNPVQLARVADEENRLRSGGPTGAFYTPITHCPKGHHKQGMKNCPPCKSEYDAARYEARKSALLVAA
jgi:hypothetical protein